MVEVMQDSEGLESSYLDAVEGVRKARNTLYEAHNRLFEAYSKMYSATHNFINLEVALEVIDQEVDLMLTDATIDKVKVAVTELVKYFSVGRSLFKVTYKVDSTEVGEDVFYDFSRVSCTQVSPDGK